jgi:triosephosphate isomerase
MALWVGTSWKMHKTQHEAVSFAARLLEAVPTLQWPGVQPFVVPPATAISALRGALPEQTSVIVGAQNAHWEDAGAWTGELSVPQVIDAGAALVELGHSERRQHFNETDESVNRKVQAALRHGIRPLVCVGESASVRSSGHAVEHVLGQTDAALRGVQDVSSVLLAYEPVWAIGAAGREPQDGEVAEVTLALHAEFGDAVTAILYGGSVSAKNAARLLTVPGVAGLFVGRSAWAAEGFLRLLDIAQRVAANPAVNLAVSSQRGAGRALTPG